MLTGWRLTLSKMFLIPQRYVLGLMGFLAVVNAYVMRVCLSVAITEMVVPPPRTSDEGDQSSCPVDHLQRNGSHPIITVSPNLYPWTSTQQGLILSSFYWGYVITHLPGGIIAEKFGGKYALGLGILCTAIFTFITPFVVYATDGNWIWVIVVRVIEGLGEGTTFPALSTLLAKWIPVHERSKIGTLVFAGSQMGTVIGNAVSGALIDATGDWASVFYVFGTIGIFWVILWTLLCYSDPQSHPFISDKEVEYLKKNISNISNKKKKIPWPAIMTSKPVWALVFAQIGHDWGFFTMVTDLPKYMKDILKFNVKQNGLWTSVPYVFMWIVSMTSGWLCDFVIKRKYLTMTQSRKLFTTIASVGPAIFIILAAYSGCNRNASVGLFTIGMGFMGTFYCGMKVNALDLSPNFAGALMAVINGIGAVTGIIVPYLVGALTEQHLLSQWRTIFWIAFGVFLFTNVIFVLFASGEVQEWNSTDDVNDPEENRETSDLDLKTIDSKAVNS